MEKYLAMNENERLQHCLSNLQLSSILGSITSFSIEGYLAMTDEEKLQHELERLRFIDLQKPSALNEKRWSRDVEGQLEEIEDAKKALGLGLQVKYHGEVGNGKGFDSGGDKGECESERKDGEGMYKKLLKGEIP